MGTNNKLEKSACVCVCVCVCVACLVKGEGVGRGARGLLLSFLNMKNTTLEKKKKKTVNI